MRSLIPFLSLLVASATVVVEAGQTNPHDRAAKFQRRSSPPVFTKDAPRVRSTSTFLNDKTKKFAVNGSAIPDVDFNIGESYAGLLPISGNPKDVNELWFWFFASDNPKAKKEITIWLNGGPGCSSLDGLLQEHGPFLWQSGTYAPVQNPYSWTNLTNMIYIDQPVSTGFSKGSIPVNDEGDVAKQFMGFWKNLVDTFSLHGYKVYITGESYAGQYIPYIAGAMLDAEDEKYFNVKGIQINDPSINSESVMIEVPSVPAMIYFNNVLNLNDTFVERTLALYESSGYADYFTKHTTTFPPTSLIPNPPALPEGADFWGDIITAAYYSNPCFNFYHLTDYCPFLWDQMVFPSLGGGPNNYFNRRDVQKAINAPPTDYFVCSGGANIFPNGGDPSLPSALGPLPSVIERTNNTIIGHGMLDFLLFSNGSLITIQNMTWNGLQGFQKPLSATKNFYVPYHESLVEIQDLSGAANPNYPPQTDTAGSGYQGVTHTERGLTFVTVDLAGHEIPQYVPGAAYRQLEFLLGRIKSLEQKGDFEGQTGNYTGGNWP